MALLPEVPAERRLLDTRDVSQRRVPLYLYVLHTTGAGIVQRALDAGYRPDDAEGIAHFAARFYAGDNEVSTHLLVDWAGHVWQICRLDVDAWHSGYSPAMKALYYSPRRTEWMEWSQPLNGSLVHQSANDYTFWRAAHPGLSNPTEMLSAEVRARHGSPNMGSISIDLVATIGGRPWSAAQLGGLRQALTACGRLTGVLPTLNNVRRHSDLDPVYRGSVLRSRQIVEFPWDSKDLDLGAVLS